VPDKIDKKEGKTGKKSKVCKPEKAARPNNNQ
jgi:hypothetical protein